jgi:hypothetical protein
MGVLIAFLWLCYVLNHADRQVVYMQKAFGYSAGRIQNSFSNSMP